MAIERHVDQSEVDGCHHGSARDIDRDRVGGPVFRSGRFTQNDMVCSLRWCSVDLDAYTVCQYGRFRDKVQSE